jgi:hypothetical protein
MLMERVVWDQFQRAVDPQAPASYQRQMSQRKRDFGQDFWWAPGQTLPSRPPDVSRVLSTR